MNRILSFIDTLASDESGATMLEYSLLIGLITAGSVALIAGGGAWVTEQWQTMKTAATTTAVGW